MIILIIMLLSCISAIAFFVGSLFESDEKIISKNMLVCTISLVICIGSFIFMVYPHDTEIKYDYSFDIYALEDNATVKGRRWYFEEDFKYYYLASYKDGKKMYYTDKNDAYIVEQDNVNPHIEVFEEKYKNKYIGKVKDESMLKTEYKIVVPKNTLTNNFNVDMKK